MAGRIERALVGRQPARHSAGGVFAGLSALEWLSLDYNQLATLPAGVFDGLSELKILELQGNQLGALPAGVFAGLSALKSLSLEGNQLATLPAGVFAGLSELAFLRLDDNQLATLPAGVFAELSALEELWLHDNHFATLSAGVFAGLATALRRLTLHENPGSPLPLTVSLASVGSTGEVRATIHTGAPFAFEVPVSVTNGATDDCVAVAKGSIESTAFTVTRTLGSAAPVTVDIGALPDLPPGHAGYVLEKSPALPLQLEPVHTLPLVMSASNAGPQGFVRLINRSDRAGTVRIHAIDDSGQRFGPVFLSLAARAGVQFNSGDLEEGAPSKGLSGGVGEGEGSWRLELVSDLEIEPLAYIRTADGFVTSIHEVSAEEGRCATGCRSSTREAIGGR